MWLTTLSTVLAVATGMFTLRDRIFPSDSGMAAASPAAFEESVGEICTALNGANAARPRETRTLMAKLRAARTTVAARNSLLDSWNHNLSIQQTQLSTLEGLDVPAGFRATFQTTATAWGTNVSRVRGFTQRLDAAASPRDLVAAVATLPTMRTAIEANAVTTDAGLRKLGDGRCMLQQPADVPVVTLPAALARGPSVDTPITAGSAPARTTTQPRKAATHPRNVAPRPAVSEGSSPVASAPPQPTSSSGAPGGHVAPNASPPATVAPAPVGPQVEPGAASGGGGEGGSGGGGSAAAASGG